MFVSKVPFPVADDLPFTFVLGRRHSRPLMRMREWAFEQTEQGLTWTDPVTKLRVRADVREYPDTGAVEWTLTFTNCGTEPSPILEDVHALDVRIPMVGREDATLHRLTGDSFSADDWQPILTAIPRSTSFGFSSRLGRPANGACPFFNLQWKGGGVITAIGWTGQWKARLVHWFGKIRLMAGMEHLHLSLLPGESIRSPRILQLYWEGDIEQSYNQFRQTMIKHILPRVGGEVVTPPIAHPSTACYEWNASTEENVMEHFEAVKDLGFEVFWLDAYYLEGGFPYGAGNYGFPVLRPVARDRFPNGLRPIGDAAHEAGMKWLLWFEVERIVAGSYMDTEHPDWLLSAPDQEWKLLDLGNPEAREYTTRFMIESIEAHGMDWLRPDSNIDPLPFWRAEDLKNPNRAGIAEIRHVEGLYQMLDDIVEAHPHLRIDNSVSGGRRIDLEMSARSVSLWRTDYVTIAQEIDGDYDQGALLNQAITQSLNRYVPFSLTGQHGELPYWFRSGFNGGIAFCQDCRPEYYPRDVLKAGIAEGKRIRKYFFGNFYPLTKVSIAPNVWCATQYHLPAENAGMVLAFRRHKAPRELFSLGLREIDPDVMYSVRYYHSYSLTSSLAFRGSELQGLIIQIGDMPGSLLLEYSKIG